MVGTRPNFIKVTRFKEVAERFPDLSVKIVHTGQHYDDKMAKVFFDQFGLHPDVMLQVPPAHPGLHIANSIAELVKLFIEQKPDMVMVVGDVNATLAAAIAANKCEIPIAHLESGLRSFDPTMPEEHNRKVADELSNLHFITEDSGLANLRAEGKTEQGLAFVGNTMIDTLVAFSQCISESKVLSRLGIQSDFALVTIHRPATVDSPEGLSKMLEVLEMVASKTKAVFPIHPRTLKNLNDCGLRERLDSIANLSITEPLGYFDFQKLVSTCVLIITDSGGIQEETTFLRKPCLTLRPNTERPVTVDIGSNTLLPFDLPAIESVLNRVMDGTYKQGVIPALWDGKSTERVLERIVKFFEIGY